MSDDTLDEALPQGWTSGRIVTIGLAIALVAGVLAGGYYQRSRIFDWFAGDPTAWPCFIISIIAALLPAAICFAQTVTRRRLLDKLRAVDQLKIGETVYFISAQNSFESIVPAAITGDYLVPLIVNVLSNFLLFMLIFNAFTFDAFLRIPNLFLVGIVPASLSGVDLETYQRGTFSVMGAAFLGNYIYTLAQLLSRVNNNDLFPISLHFYSARAVIAMTTACIFRHSAHALGVNGSDLLMLMGFAAGLAPDLMIVALSRRAFQYLKVWGSRGDPTVRPTSLALLEIDDLTRDKIDRLSELGIDSAHALSRQNPFIIWAKLPYDLGLIIDWIAQAQLYVIVRDEGLANLRKILVTDVFDFRCRLEGEAAMHVLDAVGLTGADAAALSRQFEEDEAYNRLHEVRLALLPGNFRGSGVDQGNGARASE